MLALSDQDIYDEVLFYARTNNNSCYVDVEKPTAEKVVIKGKADAPEVYEYDDDSRRNDEIEYWAAGKMRGVTITFYPDKDTNASQFTLSDAVINGFIRKDGEAPTGMTVKHAEKHSEGKYYTNSGPNYANYGTLGTNLSRHDQIKFAASCILQHTEKSRTLCLSMVCICSKSTIDGFSRPLSAFIV